MTATYMLTTPRLTLRPVAPADGPALHAHWTTPGVRRFLWDDVVIPGAQVDEIVAESQRLFETEGYGLWALHRRDASAADLFGCAGYWWFHEPPQLELVISLSPPHWGYGYATEAGEALIAYGFAHLGFSVIHASTDAPNAASLRLIERLGFTFVRRADARGLDTFFFERTRASRSTATGSKASDT